MNHYQRFLILGGVVGALLNPCARADVDVRQLRTAVEQWVELQDTLHREQTDWNHQRESLEHNLALLERERDQLTARIAAATAEMDEQTEAQWEEEQLRTALRQTLADAAQLIPAASREPAPERLRELLDTSVREHRAHRTLHIDRVRMTTPTGRQIQMQQLRLGHAQAYAVSPDDHYAAHGVWDGSDWQWQWNPAWATGIRTALRIVEGDIAPRWVPLPVTLLNTEVPE